MSFPRNKVAVNKEVSLDKKRKVSEEYVSSSKKKSRVVLDGDNNNLSLRIDTVSAASYVPGCLVFGYVLQVLPQHILVSLPGGVTGIVPETEILDRDIDADTSSSSDTPSPQRTSRVDVNDPLLCFVIGKSATDKQLRLSIRNSVVNRGINFKNLSVGLFLQGTVVSKEDHG
jgi:hypothetical protein